MQQQKSRSGSKVWASSGRRRAKNYLSKKIAVVEYEESAREGNWDDNPHEKCFPKKFGREEWERFGCDAACHRETGEFWCFLYSMVLGRKKKKFFFG